MLQWAALLHNEAAVARFADESSIFLHKSATRFIYEAPDGTRTGQLTRFVTSQYRAKVRALLDFRNYYAQSAVLLCKEVLYEKDASNMSYKGAHIKSAQWARSVEATSLESGLEPTCLEPSPPSPPSPRQASCVRMRQDGGVRVMSLDHSAQVTLDPTGR